MLLTCAAFDETVQVPTNLVAETPELRKKVNHLRGTAGPRRAALIVARAKEQQKSASKLSYMDSPIGPETQPQPVKSKLVIPPAVMPPSSPSSQSSEELVVRIGFKLLYRLLTITFSTGGARTWRLFPQEAQGCFRSCGRIEQDPLTQSAAACFSEGDTGPPIIVAGASAKLHVRLSVMA